VLEWIEMGVRLMGECAFKDRRCAVRDSFDGCECCAMRRMSHIIRVGG